MDAALFWVVARLAGFNHGNLLLLWVLFEAVLISQWEGNTIGKRMLGIRVVTEKGNQVGFYRAFGRTLGKIVSTIFFLLGDLWMLWDKDSRTWHDKLSWTRVVKHDQ